MDSPKTNPDLSALLLAFYECLSDPQQLDSLMGMVTSWLDDGDEPVQSPELDYHAEQAWRLLGEMADAEPEPLTTLDAVDVEHFETAEAIDAAFSHLLTPEDQERLRSWMAAKTGSMLLRVFDDATPDLVVITRDEGGNGFWSKRTGPDFQSVISKFVADNFGLTYAESTLVQQLLLGGTLREISARLGKSVETVRSQIKSLTGKLGVNSQADILRLMNQATALMPTPLQGGTAAVKGAARSVRRPDGRTVFYEVDGPPGGKTLLYLHGLTQGRHWPEKAQGYARDRGWRVVRISRAGRAPSSVNLKQGEALLQDHVDDVMAVMDQEDIAAFSIFGASDGFSIGYALSLQHPERVRMIVGIEITPPILTHQIASGFTGKMKTYGLTCLYAPKTMKLMFGLAIRRIERMEDRYSGVHPLMGVELGKIEDDEGIRADDRNFRDLMVNKADGMWRDSTYAGLDWAFTPPNSNVRPRAALIHCRNSMIQSPGPVDEFAKRIGAPVLRLDSYLPYISAPLPLVLDTLDPVFA